MSITSSGNNTELEISKVTLNINLQSLMKTTIQFVDTFKIRTIRRLLNHFSESIQTSKGTKLQHNINILWLPSIIGNPP